MSNQLRIAALNEVIVRSEADLPTPVGGKIPLENGINYIVSANILSLTNSLDLSNITSIASLQIGNNIISYSGVDELLLGNFSGAFIINNGLIISSTGNNKMWDIVGDGNPASNILIVDKSTFVGFSGAGIIDTIGAINYTSIQHANCGTGLVFKDCGILSINNSPINNIVDSKSPRFVLDGEFGDVSISNSSLTINSLESFLQISKDIVVNNKIIVEGCRYSNTLGGEFLASNKTGSITKFEDNLSSGTTVTSTGHTLTIEQVVEITGTTNYNGIHQIFNINVTGGTFDIPVVFSGDDATGAFDTGDSNLFLDDNRFNFNGNGDQIDTNEVIKFTNAEIINITITGTSLDGSTAIPIVGDAIDWVSTTQRRFELQFSGDPNGTARYIGLKPLLFRPSARVTADSVAGPAKQFTTYITINGVVQFESKFTVESARPTTFNPEDLIFLEPNDVIGLAIENNDDTSDIDILFVNMNIIKA